MRRTLGLMWRRHRLLTVAFLAAAGITLLLAVRTTAFYVYWANHRAVPVEPWMTVGYVARSWEVSPTALREALGLPLQVRDRRSIAQIARDKGVPVEVLVAEIETALAAAQRQEKER